MILIVIAASFSILVGSWLSGIKTVNWLVLPILTVPAVVLPLGALLALGTRNFRWEHAGNPGAFSGLGMTLIPFVLLILEIVIAILIFFGVIAYIITQPELLIRLQGLSQQILVLGPQSEAARDLLSPLAYKTGRHCHCIDLYSALCSGR